MGAIKTWTKDSALIDLKKQWTTVGRPLAFSGENAIYRYYNGALPLKLIRQFLSEQYVYTTHKETHRVKERNPYFVHEKRALCEIDLIQLTDEVKRANHDFGYILSCIDAFTKFAWTDFVYTKSPIDVVPVFEKMLSRMRKNGKYPEVLISDM